MWQISDMKNRAHFYMNTAYWRSVLTGIVLAIVTGTLGVTICSAGLSGMARFAGMSLEQLYRYFDLGIPGVNPVVIARMGVLAFGLAFVLFIIGLCIDLFVLQPIEVGCRRFFVVNHAMPGRTKSGEIFHVFSDHYIHVVGVMLRKEIQIFLWTLLLVIPGIIKHYSYRLVPYILAEEPGMPTADVIRLSREMMRGNKWHAFLLDLSFIGWHILNALTLGFLGVFYVRPYQATANAEMYITVRDRYLHR